MRLIITGVASTCTLPLPTRGAVCSSPTRSSALPFIPALSLPRSTHTMVAALQQGAGVSELDFTMHAPTAWFPSQSTKHCARRAFCAGPRAPSRSARARIAFDLRFLALEAPGVAGGELVRFEALLDALLPVDVALEAAAEEGCGKRADSVTTCIIAAWRPRAWSSWAAALAVCGLPRRCARHRSS